MSADLSSLVTAFTESTNAVSAMIASLVTLFGVLRFKRRARVEIATAAVVERSAGAGHATLLYMSNAVPDAAMANPGLPSATIYAPQGTVTKLPQWITGTHTPLVLLGILLIVLFDVTSLRRTPKVGPVSERVAPVITDARAFIYEYDHDGNIGSDCAGYIVFNIAGTWDGLGRVTRAIPPTSTERSDVSWVVDLKEVSGFSGLAVSGLEPGDLIGARLKLRPGDTSAHSVVLLGGDVTPVDPRMVYVYAGAFGDDIQSSDKWIKVGEGTLTPSGSWSVVGSVPGDWSRTHTTPLATAKMSLTAIVVSSEDAAVVTTTSTLADLDAMGRSEIVTVVPRRRLEWGHGTSGVVGDPSRTTPVTGVPSQR
jgi:hypothetical protein